MSAAYQFIPWVRRGLAATVQQPETLGPLPARAQIRAGVVISGVTGDADGRSPGVSVRLYGPGDIIGIDSRLFVRLEPRPDAVNFEPNYFPAIEFDPPDFPWMLTPAAPDKAGKLRPWLVLVVVDAAKVRPPAMAGGPLPVVTIPREHTGSELPDLSESWAWAHAQVTSESRGASVNSATLNGDPHRNVSRLLCPRRLEPNKNYLACLVPSFSVGVQRALGGEPPANAQLEPAWVAPSPSDVRLPVYFHWSFATGAEGDFESLARKLVAMPCPDGVGQARMDVRAAGEPLSVPEGFAPEPGIDFSAGAMRVQGALRNRHLSSQALAEVPAFLQDGLARALNAPAEIIANANANANASTTALAPPFYGAWPAKCHTVGAESPTWLRELNLDPRQRVAASLGAEAVRANQEELMQVAWEQVGQILEANRLLNSAALYQEAAASLYRRFILPLAADRAVQLAAPAHARLLDPTSRITLRAGIARTSLPDSTMDGAMRRLASPQRPLLKSLARTAGSQLLATRSFRSRLTENLAADRADADPRRFKPDGLVGLKGLDRLIGGVDATVSLEPLGMPYSIPAASVARMRSNRDVVGGRDFGRQPLRLEARANLAATGLLVQEHLDAIREGLNLFAGADAGGADRITETAILAKIAENAAAIGDRPTLLIVKDHGFELGTLTTNVAARTVSVTFLGSGETRRVAELSPALAGALSAGNPNQSIGRLGVLPLSEAGGAVATIDAGPGNLPRISGRIGLGLQDHVPAVSQVVAVDALGRGATRLDAPGRLRPLGVGAGAAAAAQARVSPRVGPVIAAGGGPGVPVALPGAGQPAAGAVAEVSLGKILPPLLRGASVPARFAAALTAVVDVQAIHTKNIAPPTVPFDLAAAAEVIKQRLDPRIVIPARTRTLISSADGRALLAVAGVLEDDGVAISPRQDRVLAAPELPYPAYHYVADLDKERLLPGIGLLDQPNLITLVETNPRFVEACLIGLNHEMSCELLWRSYPTDRRGTPFRHFWPWFDQRPDIPPLHTLTPDRALGGNAANGLAGGQIVLLVRGELLRRYPNTVIYAWKATRKDGRLTMMPEAGNDIRRIKRDAAFMGPIEPDYMFVGLTLTDAELDEPDGWYIVLQEQPTDTRFGLDEPATEGVLAAPPAKLADASWAHTGTPPGGHLSLGKPGNQLGGHPVEGVTFGKNGAHNARFTLQSRFRLIIHTHHLDSARLAPA